MMDDDTILSTSIDNNSTDLLEEDAIVETSGGTKKEPSAFRTISEVADEIHVPQHVLRFWESRFTQVQPVKRSGGRRYYRAEDIELLRYISELLYVHGYTIKGVQRLLKEDFSRFEADKKLQEEVNHEEEISILHESSNKILEDKDHKDSTLSIKHDIDNYLQEIDYLKKENNFLTNSLEGILIELNELRKIILNS